MARSFAALGKFPKESMLKRNRKFGSRRALDNVFREIKDPGTQSVWKF